MKLILSKILYFIGDCISKLFCYRLFRYLAEFLYPVYSWVMIMSSDLDKDGKIWKILKERESNERANDRRDQLSKRLR